MSRAFLDKVSNICNIAYMKISEENKIRTCSQTFRVIGHPMRLAIIEALHERPWCVCELAQRLG
jgi:hypothetical protein